MVYRAPVLRGLAVTQMVFGALMIVFGVACIFSVDHWSSYIAFGIWVGVWVLIAGILGFVGTKDDARPNKCLIGCFMGFSVTACVLAVTMFICYCVAVDEFAATIRHCRSGYYNNYYNSDAVYPTTSNWYYPTTQNWYYRYRCSTSKWYTASAGAGLGSCQLIFSLVEFFIALASSIYCCNAVCCGADPRSVPATNQQIMYLQPQMYPGGQAGVVVMQPSGAMATVPHGYAMAGHEQAVFMPPQPVPAGQQPGYWAMPSGSNPAAAGTVTMPYAGATAAPNQAQALQQAMKQQERPPPYAYTQTGNAPPSVSASGAATSDDVPGAMAV